MKAHGKCLPHGRLAIAVVACGWAAVTMAAATAAAGQASGQLTGSVKDVTNLPLAEVSITVRGADERVTRTDVEGHFEVQNLAEGDYEVTAALPGFATVRRTVRLSDGDRAVVSMTMSVLLQEESVVTGTRLGEADVQATPAAISALPEASLERLQAHTVEHIAGLVPSTTFSQNTGFAQVTIRGIGTNVVFAGSDPSSAVYVDGVYLARPVMVLTDFLDLERVEVLRGPQGTLYGRNAVGGAINVISKVPTNTLDASVRFGVGGHGMLRTEARLSGPIVGGRLMGSAAVLRGTRNGFVRDLGHPGRPLGGEDVTAARGQLRVVFDRRSELLLSADLTHQDPVPLTYAKVLAVKPGFQVDNPPDLHEVRTSTPPESRNLQYGSAARLTVHLTPATQLTSLSAYRSLDYDVVNDADITELELTVSHVHEIQHQFSEELTVAHQGGRLDWIGGLFYLNEIDRQPTLVRFGGPRLENELNPRVEADGSAVFGQATIGLTSRVSVTGGLRYSDERKSIDNAGRISPFDSPATVVPGSAYAYADAIRHAAWTPKAGLEVRARGNALAYVSATRGFKSGGFNPTSREPGFGYAPEWAWSYEGGLKTLLADGRTRLNVSVFQTDYTDLQVQTAIRPGVIDISNAAAATIRGVELESAARMSSRVQAGGHVAWLDATYDRYTAVGVGGVTGDVAGRRLTNAPEWSGRLWLEWNPEIGRDRSLSLRADSTWQTTVFFTPFNDTVQRQAPYGLLHVSAELRPTHRPWFVTAYARNLTDADYITGTFSSPPPAIGGRPGDTRQAGVQFAIQR